MKNKEIVKQGNFLNVESFLVLSLHQEINKGCVGQI